MSYLYLGTIIGLCFFNLWSYRRGMKDGIALSQGKPIEPIQTPVQAYTAHVERREDNKKTAKEAYDMSLGLANLMAYDGTPQEKPKDGEK